MQLRIEPAALEATVRLSSWFLSEHDSRPRWTGARAGIKVGTSLRTDGFEAGIFEPVVIWG